MTALLLLLLTTATPREYTATLVQCYDGDTCYFNFHVGLGLVLANQPVRFCDINTPEVRPLATREAGLKSRDALRAWLKAAKEIVVRIPQKDKCSTALNDDCDKKEKYGRWLGYVIADGAVLNERLIAESLATKFMSCE